MASMKVFGVPSGLCWRHMASKADFEAVTHASSGPYKLRTCMEHGIQRSIQVVSALSNIGWVCTTGIYFLQLHADQQYRCFLLAWAVGHSTMPKYSLHIASMLASMVDEKQFSELRHSESMLLPAH